MYCTPDDLKDAYDFAHLAQLTGDAAGAQVDDGKIARAIGDYGDYMEASVRMQHPDNPFGAALATVNGDYDGSPTEVVDVSGLADGVLFEKGRRLVVRSTRITLANDITGDADDQTLETEPVALLAAIGDAVVGVNKMLCGLNVEGAFLLLQKRNPTSPGALDEDLLRAEKRLDGILRRIADGELRLMSGAEKAAPVVLDVASSHRYRERLFGRDWA